jgi:glycosyltransferase involved in cell wall biosynthesis
MPKTAAGPIVHVLGALAAGGAERFVVNLASELRARGRDVRVLTLSARTDQAGREMARELRVAGVPVLAGPSHRVRGRAVAFYLRKISQLKPAILHLHMPNSELAYTIGRFLLRRPLAVVRTVHCTELCLSRMESVSFRHNDVDLSVFCSVASLEHNEAMVRGPKRVVPYGIRFDWPTRTEKNSFEFKTKLGLDPSLTHYVHVGRQDGPDLSASQKAHDLLIRGWRRSKLGRLGGQLHLLGDGPLRGRLEALAENDPSVIFHGVRNDVRDWLLACDRFVMPSRFEGLPIAAIEAIGTGLPCVLTDIAPFRELQPPVALYSPVDAEEELAKNLESSLSVLRRPATERIEAFRTRYGVERVADDYEACYAQLLAPLGSQRALWGSPFLPSRAPF